MTPTIAYDRPVANFIDALSATGHVTHTAYRKTSVTFHHNAGRLSLQGILDVWKIRPASAHFQSDGLGRLGQYVKVNEYAWATGNTEGNKSSISIEMANATLSPGWTVAEATWKSGARLCGWLHAKVLGVRPTRNTVRMHMDWKATGCPGPYIQKILNSIIAESQKAYDYFTGKTPAEDVITVDITPAQLLTLIRQGVRAEFTTVGTPTRTQVMDLAKRGAAAATAPGFNTLIYGDNRTDVNEDTTDTHPENLQRIRQDMTAGFEEIKGLLVPKNAAPPA